ncbi:Hypothetical predicted protein [Prunus dulcis]|uniref:Uncharacterized protein n=1 Tax=Prunus dulcis TaxID=3755 RepID=A0A5E4EJM2_PRUDU|nr:Hypothetical predicted protein [Prunus dulcis]
MELARMFRFNRTFAPTTPDLQPHHQERLISIMASIQVDSPTVNFRFRDLNSSLRIGVSILR